MQKVLAIKPYILNVIRHKTLYKKGVQPHILRIVKGEPPHIYVLSIKSFNNTGL